MTYEEAFHILLETIMPVDKENEALEKALEALKEKLPRKPLEDIGNSMTVFKCPRCHSVIACKVDESFVFYALLENNICKCCGQEIDWSDEE